LIVKLRKVGNSDTLTVPLYLRVKSGARPGDQFRVTVPEEGKILFEKMVFVSAPKERLTKATTTV
jgi:antitoxin component of MazEF toxin-antitoxin module